MVENLVTRPWIADLKKILLGNGNAQESFYIDILVHFIADIEDKGYFAGEKDRDRFWLEKVLPKEKGERNLGSIKSMVEWDRGYNQCLDEIKSNYARMKGDK